MVSDFVHMSLFCEVYMVTLLLILGVTLIIGSMMLETVQMSQRQPIRIRTEDRDDYPKRTYSKR